MVLSSRRRRIFSWALYDWANSAFATTVMAGFFPVFFSNYWSQQHTSAESNFQLGIVNSIASLGVVLLAPILGVIADQTSSRKRFLLFFVLLGALSTVNLFWVAAGGWKLASLFYILAAIGFSSSNLFYDSLLVEVASPKERNWVSALGFSVGYLGGGFLFAFNIAMVTYPFFFGFEGVEQATHFAFLTVGLWWLVFTLPLAFWVKEPNFSERVFSRLRLVEEAIKGLRLTFSETQKYKPVLTFLIGYWFYIDGVGTIVRMASAYGLSIGLSQIHIVQALLLTQIVGVPASLFFGKIGQLIGVRPGILICIGVYVLTTIRAAFITSRGGFLVLAASIGLVQGGIQALSRSYYVHLIPEKKAAEFFGFYNMVGKFAAVLGPLLMGSLGLWTNSPRFSILAVTLLFLIGAVFLMLVDEGKNGRNVISVQEI